MNEQGHAKADTNFKVGNRVLWSGAKGIVVRIGSQYEEYPVRVLFGPHVKEGSVVEVGFLGDGRFLDFHREPSIKKIGI